MAEECSGLTGSFEAIRWYRAPANRMQAEEGPGTVAFWASKDNRVVLADRAAESARIVRHEMLHALAQQQGHPRDLFLGKCAGLVRCDEACEVAAGPPPPRDRAVVSVPLDSLVVTVSCVPDQPSSRWNEGAFQVTVVVTNPASHPVFLALPAPAAAFSLRVLPSDWRLIGDRDDGARELRWFAAGEAKSYVFDLRANDSTAGVVFTAGDYRLVGGFSTRTSAPMVLRIEP